MGITNLHHNDDNDDFDNDDNDDKDDNEDEYHQSKLACVTVCPLATSLSPTVLSVNSWLGDGVAVWGQFVQ